MSLSSPTLSPRVLLTSSGRGWRDLEAELLRVPRGSFQLRGSTMHHVGIHVGPPVNADCRCDGRRLRRVQKTGDIDVVPAGVEGSWEDDAECRILRLSLPRSLIHDVAQQLGRDPDKTQLWPQLQLRDARLEAIGWAIKAELEARTPSDPLYAELLANALAVRLIETARGGSPPEEDRSAPKLSPRRLRALTDHIESNLGQKLRLADLASVAGVSVTRLKALFRNSTGLPVHQYVIRRRVEYAQALLETTTTPASEVALAAGFSHQSHMASTLRRLLGKTPGDIARRSSEFRPKLQKPA